MSFANLKACASVCADLNIGKVPTVTINDCVMWASNDSAVLETAAPFTGATCAFNAQDLAKVAARFDTPDVKLSDAGSLVFREKGMVARVRSLPDVDTVSPFIESNAPARDGTGLIEALSAVSPFISTDATRPWSLGVLLLGGFVYATNNVCVARAPTALQTTEPVMLTSRVVSLILSLPPVSIVQTDDRGVVLSGDDYRLRASRALVSWPDVAGLFKVFPDTVAPFPPAYRDAVQRVAMMGEGRVTFESSRVWSKGTQVEVEYEGEASDVTGTYVAAVARQVAAHATHASTVVTDVRGKSSPVVYFTGDAGLQALARGIVA